MDNRFYDFMFKIIIVGDSGVGKSSLLNMYKTNKFDINIKPTIGVDLASNIVEIDNKFIKLHIWDTTGDEKFKAFSTAFYRGSKGAFIVFDVTNENSFNNLDGWINDVTSYCPEGIYIIIVGNKIDKIKDRKISTDTAINYCKSKNISYFETSASEGTEVNSIFNELALQLYNHDTRNYICDCHIARKNKLINEGIKLENDNIPDNSVMNDTKKSQTNCCHIL